MKVVVIGGTGLIGSKVVRNLEARGHDVLAASPQSGVDTITGEGVAEAVAGADVVLDVANSPSFADDEVMAFFTTAGHHLLDAEAAAGVGHHVVLSIVGVDRLADSGYMRAKVAQEEIPRRPASPTRSSARRSSSSSSEASPTRRPRGRPSASHSDVAADRRRGRRRTRHRGSPNCAGGRHRRDRRPGGRAAQRPRRRGAVGRRRSAHRRGRPARTLLRRRAGRLDADHRTRRHARAESFSSGWPPPNGPDGGRRRPAGQTGASSRRRG